MAGENDKTEGGDASLLSRMELLQKMSELKHQYSLNQIEVVRKAHEAMQQIESKNVEIWKEYMDTFSKITG